MAEQLIGMAQSLMAPDEVGYNDEEFVRLTAQTRGVVGHIHEALERKPDVSTALKCGPLAVSGADRYRHGRRSSPWSSCRSRMIR